jgi:lipid A ethanolaminephosphotransferase
MNKKIPILSTKIILSSNQLIIAFSTWLLLFSNWPFWRVVWKSVGGLQDGSILFVLSLPWFVLMWLYVLLSAMAWGRFIKPVLAIVLLVAAAASYFMNSYGIVIDYSMLTNVIQTDISETTDLLNWELLRWMLGFGVLPVLLITRVRLIQRSRTRALAHRLMGLAAALTCLAIIVFTLYQSYASLVRNHRELRLMLVPSNVVSAIHGYMRRQLAQPTELKIIGADARQGETTASVKKSRLTLLIVGETARSANFSLNGYTRDTNPELTRRGVLSFTNVSSCGTATAISLPCMFLDAGKQGYKDGMALRREGLLDVLQRAGVSVLWRDNNSGCKGICDRVKNEKLNNQKTSGLCRAGECYDEVLLQDLQAYLDQQQGDSVVVLHMKGSHGPSYYKRYPREFERFGPVCDNNQLERCTRESIVSAYDNSIVYTDYVLGQTIDLLKRNAERFDTAMLYVSDHGESLGENGIYLHGLPYAMAPKEQTSIPMVLWISKNMQSRQKLDVQCLREQRGASLSHDNLFHSILGLMNIQTSAYRPELDLFSACQSKALASLKLTSMTGQQQ